MAITFEAVTTDRVTGKSVTFSHTTPSGANRLLIVHGSCTTGTARVTAVTYAGVSMTLGVESAGDSYQVIYYLVAPATGANDVVMTWNPAPTANRAIQAAVSYSGVAQTGSTGVTGTDGVAGTNTSIAVTTQTANSWLVSNAHFHGNPSTITTDSPNVERYNIFEIDANRPHAGGDQPTTSVGSYTSSYTSNVSESLGHVVMEIKVAGAAATSTPSNLLTLGVG